MPAAEPAHRRAARYAWALLLARIDEVFPLWCPKCGGAMRIIAFVKHLSVVFYGCANQAGEDNRNVARIVGAACCATYVAGDRPSSFYDATILSRARSHLRKYCEQALM